MHNHLLFYIYNWNFRAKWKCFVCFFYFILFVINFFYNFIRKFSWKLFINNIASFYWKEWVIVPFKSGEEWYCSPPKGTNDGLIIGYRERNGKIPRDKKTRVFRNGGTNCLTLKNPCFMKERRFIKHLIKTSLGRRTYFFIP